RVPYGPIAFRSPTDHRHEPGVQERRCKRGEKDRKADKHSDAPETVKADLAVAKVAKARSSDEGFADVANEPAQNQYLGNAGLQLDDHMNRKRRKHDDPPLARWREQEGGEENRIRWPESRDGIGLKRQRKAQPRSDIISGAYQECIPGNPDQSAIARVADLAVRSGPTHDPVAHTIGPSVKPSNQSACAKLVLLSPIRRAAGTPWQTSCSGYG